MAVKSLSAQISEAIRNEDLDLLDSIFQSNPDQTSAFTYMGGQTWLGYAAQIGRTRAVNKLIEIGADVNKGDKRDFRAPICSAAANGHYEVVECLLNNGAQFDVSESIRNALFSAIIGRSPRIVRLLLEAGIDSRIVYNSETMTDMDAVAFSLMRGEKECAEIIALWNSGGNREVAKAMLGKADFIADKNAR